jgi:hypothetical protein
MERAPMVTGVHTDKLSAKLAIGALLVAKLAAFATVGCQSSDRADGVGSALSAEVTQVKPAAARAQSEPETLAKPEQEAPEADLPRGVSAPQPEARYREVPSAAAPRPTSTTAPSAKATETIAKSKALDVPASPAVKKPPLPAMPTSSKPTLSQSKAKPAAPKAPPAAPVAPEPITESAAPAPAPKKASVNVPQTDHVRVEVPAGLQHWLDEDDRMRPWLGKAINVADSCYAKVRADDPGASGEIAFVVTMHENARPSGRVSSVSSPISGIVMCATTRLLGVKMPLFTGTEGESYTVRVRFTP